MRAIRSALLLCALLVFPQYAGMQDISIGRSETVHGDIQNVQTVPCETSGNACLLLRIIPRSGSFAGDVVEVRVNPGNFLLGEQQFRYEPGDAVILESQEVNGSTKFFVADILRTGPLFWLTALFCAAVLFFGGRSGGRALLGMCLSFCIVLGGMLPAMLHGYSPVLISIVGGSCIMLATLVLSHGWNVKSISALAGTGLSLAVTGILSVIWSQLASLSGLADEDVLLLLQSNITIDPQGLLLAGIIIGTLGVLDDITIAQTSAVLELRLANASLSTRAVYRRAIRIGTDHVAAAVNTLVLAYAGAALPLLLLIATAPDQGGILTILNREIFATEIVRTLAGSIGLLTAVPFTTYIASKATERMSPQRLAQLCHGHGHAH